MIKIKWIDDERRVPGVGTLRPGDIRRVDDAIGAALIRQGQAVKVKKPAIKKTNTKGD